MKKQETVEPEDIEITAVTEEVQAESEEMSELGSVFYREDKSEPKETPSRRWKRVGSVVFGCLLLIASVIFLLLGQGKEMPPQKGQEQDVVVPEIDDHARTQSDTPNKNKGVSPEDHVDERKATKATAAGE